MPAESYFMAFGALGLTLAGFAGLISALNRRPVTDVALAAYRARTIVFLGFSLTFVGFGTVAVYPLTGPDVGVTMRIGSALMTIPFLRGLLIDTRPGPVWPAERERRATIVVLLLMLAAAVANVVVGDVGLLQIVLLLGLLGPVSIFYATIKDATEGDSAPADAASEAI